MLKNLVFSTGAVGLLVLAVLKNGPVPKVEDFTLEGSDGAKHSLYEHRDSKAIVLMFVATQCPVSNSYNERMKSLYADYTPKHVAFVAINSNVTEDAAEVKKHAAEKGFPFPVLKDENSVVAEKLGATVTPEIYVLSPEFDVLYHGRIDNSGREEKVTSKDLRNALDEVLGGKAVSVTTTKVFGCTIKKAS